MKSFAPAFLTLSLALALCCALISPHAQAKSSPNRAHTHHHNHTHAAKAARRAGRGGNQERANAVKDVFRQSYSDYLKYAAPSDLILNGWGGSIVDALDTMLIMGLDDLYAQALHHTAQVDFKKTCCGDLSLFETTIRYVGGMMSAYELNGQKDDILVKQATILADGLSHAWVNNNKIPYNSLNLARGQASNSQGQGIAQAGSLILEFGTLSKHTGNQTYLNLANEAMKAIINSPAVFPGLYAQGINPSTNQPTDDYVTWGGGSDSFFEYLIKWGQLSGGQDDTYVSTWNKAVESSIEHLIVRSGVGNYTYLSDYSASNGGNIYTFSHLGCFAAGNWALGGQLLKNAEITEYGLELVRSCANTYNSTATGVGPEAFGYVDAQGRSPGNNITAAQEIFYKKHGFFITTADYLLRPEVLESVFYAYRITGDTRYQDIAWDAFNAIKKYCKAPAAYASLNDVNTIPPPQLDDSESFWYAETLKYLYLTFSDFTVIDLDEYVFNTEAHPYKIESSNPNFGTVQASNNHNPPQGVFDDMRDSTARPSTNVASMPTKNAMTLNLPSTVRTALHSGLSSAHSRGKGVIGSL